MRTAHAQAPGGVKRIGVLAEGQAGQAVRTAPPPDAVEALRKRGWIVGTNVLFEFRQSEQREQLPALARQLVDAKVDVILAFGTPATRAAKAATTTVPIVFNLGSDPVANGLVASLSHPGGNLTGFVEGVLDDKLIEIFRDAMPKARRVVIAEAPLSPRAGRA
ncbi:MAG: ABC transporter substrate-binding protein, partial [Burkholderiales bacterium]|nr:ABC transporter substrate-binding protein [Burkholderiales bacterium]